MGDVHVTRTLLAPRSRFQIFDSRHIMYTATRNGPSTSAPGHGSRTLTITNSPTQEENDDEQGDDPESSQIIGTLNLRVTRQTGPRVGWDERVIDNEEFGKKKSKVCCIYHKPRRFDESSDESSDSDSSSSSCPHEHDHPGHSQNRPNPSPRGSSSSNLQQAQRGRGVVHEPELLDDIEPNAYEQQPELKKGKRKAT